MTPSERSPRPLVDYLVARDGVPARSGLAFDYLLAADGLFVATESDLLVVRLPVARCRLRGDRIASVGAACELRRGRLPRAVWVACLAHAEAAAATGHEVAILVTHRPDGGIGGRYRVIRPPQTVTATRAEYDEPDLPPGETVLLSFHSHHGMRAYFSGTDDADERQLRLYAVVGRLGTARPEVALRVGFNGHWLPLPWESVFVGERGSFRDVQFSPSDEAGDDDWWASLNDDLATLPVACARQRISSPRLGLSGFLSLLGRRPVARSGEAAALRLGDDTREVLP